MKAEVDDGVAVASEKRRHAKPTANELIWREIVSWFWVILAFLLIEGTLVQARVIPSGSMENTVLVGDHLIVTRLGYSAGVPFTALHVPLWKSANRQQIIVFSAPLENQGFPDFIKRCIGVPGDHIKIVQGTVFVNGKALVEPYAQHLDDYRESPVENFPSRAGELPFVDRPEWATELQQNTVKGELVVPPGEYFMMGDNRDNSNDSRFWGFVPRANIIGTPLIIYMSIDAPEEVWGPGFAAQRFETYASVLIHPSRIRWNRIFHTLK